MILVAFVGFLFVAGLTGIYVLIRNDWVLKVRLAQIHRDMDSYDKWPSYNAMLYRRPFCWNVEKLVRRLKTEGSNV